MKNLCAKTQRLLDNLVDIVALQNGKNVSRCAINSYQHTIGTFNVPVMENLLSALNIQKRLEFCIKYQEDSFSNVIFSDESSFELNRNSQKVFVFKDHEAVRMKRSDRTKVMVWGAISKRGKVALHFHDESVDTDVYLEMLEEYLPKIPDRMFGEGRWRFQQDNAPAHRSNDTRNWLKDICRLISHPAQSPDLNPIEYIWAEMKDFVQDQCPTNTSELKRAIKKAWKHITTEKCITYINHVIHLMPQIIERRGLYVHKKATMRVY